MSDESSAGIGPAPPPGGAPPPPPGSEPAPLPPPDPPPGERDAGWAAPPPAGGEGPSEDEAGWAAPPPPGGYAPRAEGNDFAPPPPAPFPTSGPGAGVGAGPGPKRRRAAWLGGLAGLAIIGTRLIIAMQPDPASTSIPDFSIPAAPVGRPVDATPLTSEQICALLSPADLRAVYGVPFEAGRPVGDTGGGVTGEPSDGSASPEGGACNWRTRSGEDPLNLAAVSFPAIDGDANRTFDLLRPRSPIQGFDAREGNWDEAFVSVGTLDGGDEGYADSMTVRSDGVVLLFNITGADQPEGGLDLLVEAADTAVANIPPDL